MKRFYLFSFISLWLVVLASQTVTFADGKVENHQITSKILSDAGIPNNKKEISVYLADEYNTSELAYPALYLLHGGWWMGYNNHTFLGSGYGGAISNANAPLIADKLIANNTIEPIIILIPDMSLSKATNYTTDMPIANDYIRYEVVPFIDAIYRKLFRIETEGQLLVIQMEGMELPSLDSQRLICLA